MEKEQYPRDTVPTDCPLCGMSTGRRSRCAVVYRDDRVMATIDSRPVNPGHTLVYPRTHIESLYDLDTALYHQVLDLAKAVAASIETVFRPARVALLVSGLAIAHAHVHVVPINDITDLTTKMLIENRPESPDLAVLSMQAKMLSIDLTRDTES